VNKKSGVTFSIVIVAIIIMLIVISAATVVGTNSVSIANFERYQSEIGWVIDSVNSYYLENNKLPVTDEIVAYDTLSDGLKAALEKNSDNDANLLVIDVSLLQDSTIKNGYGSVTSKDIYIISDKTQNIYYVKGFKYKGVMYYNL
jgi:hypothetical protein